MYRYDDPSAVAALPASSAPGTAGYFSDGDAGMGIEPTLLRAEFMNMLMMELLNVLPLAQVTASKSQFGQLAQSILTLGGVYGVDIGSANALTLAATTPAIPTLRAGQRAYVKVANTNTSPTVTLTVGTLNAPVKTPDLIDLEPGDLPAGSIAVFEYDGTRFQAIYAAGRIRTELYQRATYFAAKSVTLTSPPGSPSAWDIYLVPGGATGAWAGQAGKLAVRRAELLAWMFVAPADGAMVLAADTGLIWHKIGGSWIEQIHGLTAKAIGANLDEFRLWDSAANLPKKMTFADLAYFIQESDAMHSQAYYLGMM